MFVYIVKLFLILALVSAMAAGCLWLMRRFGARVGLGRTGGNAPIVEVVGTLALGPMARLTVVEFGGHAILLSVTRGGIGVVAQSPVNGQSPS